MSLEVVLPSEDAAEEPSGEPEALVQAKRAGNPVFFRREGGEQVFACFRHVVISQVLCMGRRSLGGLHCGDGGGGGGGGGVGESE